MALITQAEDPATMQTAAGYPEVKSMNTAFKFSSRETEELRHLAAHVAEIAAWPEMGKKKKLWTAHNDLKTTDPLVFIDPENGWNEIIDAKELISQDPLARVWEMALRKQIFWAEGMKDDKVIEPYFNVPYSYSDNGWGLELKKRSTSKDGSYIVIQALKDYDTDFEKLHYPDIIIDEEQSRILMDLAHGIFDNILTVRRKNTWWWTLGMCWDFVNIRGLEDFMVDMVAEPENFHRVMNFLCEGKLKMLDFLEKNNLLALNTEGTYVGSGGFGYTEQLPRTEFTGQVTTMDMWGFVDSQETVSVGPERYEEFILPYHKRIAERFGLNCYGCCEGYNTRWQYVKQLPRLRRVSVSPWADWSTVPEFLGKDYIASVKPAPFPLAQPVMDEDVVRRDARRAVEQTKDGICEFIMKDNHTLGNNPRNATRWVEIMREEIDRVY
ncbi:hypothetical protein [Treponema primitia]|uniref:hypothetical protein n=1 Tax=Treponema primitia TaxID=88058 RepID=UPI00025556DF|nr:hypothetical protein [Treponema primitia]